MRRLIIAGRATSIVYIFETRITSKHLDRKKISALRDKSVGKARNLVMEIAKEELLPRFLVLVKDRGFDFDKSEKKELEDLFLKKPVTNTFNAGADFTL